MQISRLLNFFTIKLNFNEIQTIENEKLIKN